MESWRCKICIWDTTAYVRSQERFDFLCEANKSVARPRGEAIFIVMDSGYIQLEKVLDLRSCDLLHMDTQTVGGGILPAGFHLLPFPNTYILCSVTQAKMFAFKQTGPPSAATNQTLTFHPKAWLFHWIAEPLYCQRMCFASRQTSIWRSYIIMQMLAMSH